MTLSTLAWWWLTACLLLGDVLLTLAFIRAIRRALKATLDRDYWQARSAQHEQAAAVCEHQRQHAVVAETRAMTRLIEVEALALHRETQLARASVQGPDGRFRKWVP